MNEEEAKAIVEQYTPTKNRAVTTLSEVAANAMVGGGHVVKAAYVTRDLSKLPPTETLEDMLTNHKDLYALLVGAVTPCDSGWTLQLALESIVILDTAEKPFYFRLDKIVKGVASLLPLKGFKYDRELHAKPLLIRLKASQEIYDRETMKILSRPKNRHNLN